MGVRVEQLILYGHDGGKVARNGCQVVAIDEDSVAKQCCDVSNFVHKSFCQVLRNYFLV